MSQPSFDLDFDDGGLPTYGVRELADAVNQVLRRGFFDGVWVRGEIEGLSTRNGHTYFNLSEQSDDGRATLSVALFAPMAARLRPLLAKHRLRLQNGMAVRIHGALDYYAPSGRLSLKMDGLDPLFTVGQLAADRDSLLRKLVAAGLLDRNARQPVPIAPLRIGVVTSVGSAAWHDLVHELTASGIGFRLSVCDVRVQGIGSVESVAGAIRTLGRRYLDVVVVVRGGGSRTDLATFDAEPIARAIATSPVAVFTGLGHEVDRSVADDVAHSSFKTPTACAAALVERVRAHAHDIEQIWTTIEARAAKRLDDADVRLATTSRAVARRAGPALELAGQRLDQHARRLAREARSVTAVATAGLDRASGRVEGEARRRVGAASDRIDQHQARLRRQASRPVHAAGLALDAVEARVRALDPARALARGWSITHLADGTLVTSAHALAPGAQLVTTLAAGRVRSTVEATEP